MRLGIVRSLDLLARQGLGMPGGYLAQQSTLLDRLVAVLALSSQTGVIGG